MKKRIVFIEPIGNEANIFDNLMCLPLMGGLYLGTILKNNGYEVEFYNENILGRKIDPLEIKADIVCITGLTLSSNRVRQLAYEIKLSSPSTKIIIGGIHATLRQDDYLDIADNIVLGEAEDIIVDVIEGKYNKKIINGNMINDINKLPKVDYTILKKYKKMKILPIMTSRGCPFDCNFCSVTKVFGRGFRKQSPDRILEEIKNAINQIGIPFIFFYDDNFTADRKRVDELLDKIIAEDLNILWTAQVRADIAKDEQLLKKMYKAGCERVYIGFESVNDAVLKAYKKSQTKKDIIDAIKKIHDNGISIHGMFMIGEDNETEDSIRETGNFAIEYNVDTAQFMALTPLPGTYIFEKLKQENRILHYNWNYYDGMHVVFKPKNMPAYRLQELGIEIHKKFYSFKRNALEFLKFCFNVSFDALVLNTKNSNKYDINNIYLRAGAKFIIRDYLQLNKRYIDYLRGRRLTF